MTTINAFNDRNSNQLADNIRRLYPLRHVVRGLYLGAVLVTLFLAATGLGLRLLPQNSVLAGLWVYALILLAPVYLRYELGWLSGEADIEAEPYEPIVSWDD